MHITWQAKNYNPRSVYARFVWIDPLGAFHYYEAVRRKGAMVDMRRGDLDPDELPVDVRAKAIEANGVGVHWL
jgi:hypothetical protein